VKVLIAEDHIASRGLLEKIITKWGYDVVMASDGEKALARLQEPNGPNLAILDWMMPCIQGVEVCRQIKGLTPSGLPYLILLTARTDKGDIVKGLEAGADDYISKPFDSRELRARLAVGRRVVELHTQLKATMESLAHQALTDPLTLAPNRRAILETLAKEIARGMREGTSFWVSIVDLDRFKTVNDLHGHLAGDHVLREFVRRAQTVLRPYDSIGRLGGEEFLIVLPTPIEACPDSAFERVRAALAETPIFVGNTPLSVTVSQGVAAWKPGDTLDDLLRKADEALYRAKEAGRNRVEYHEVSATPRACCRI
jgi:two-component system, cell cycle response regulator